MKSINNLNEINNEYIESQESEIYNEKLKEKITEQAKKLTNLAYENKELLDFIKVKKSLKKSKYLSMDEQQSYMSTNPRNMNNLLTSKSENKIITLKKNCPELNYNNLLQELELSKIRIDQLMKSKSDLTNFKENIILRMKIANEEIDKSKKEIIKILKEKDELNYTLNNKEKLIKNLQSLNESLSQKNEKLYNELLNIKNDFSQISIENKKNFDSQIISLEKKNKKLFNDNKELCLKLKKYMDTITQLKNENMNLRYSNSNFSQKIDNLTNSLNIFQNDLNKKIESSSTMTIENNKTQFMQILNNKDIEIAKLTELNKHYVLLEEELNNNLQTKDNQINQYESQINQLNNDVLNIKNEYETLKNQLNFLNDENSKISSDNRNLKNNFDEINSQFQCNNNIKNSQITSLKKYIQNLENKNELISKYKKYLEHLLVYTHPKANLIKETIEIYNNINELEIQKKNLEDKFLKKKSKSLNKSKNKKFIKIINNTDSIGSNDELENDDDKNDNLSKNMKLNAINKIDKQLKLLKNNLTSMEDDIKYNTTDFSN